MKNFINWVKGVIGMLFHNTGAVKTALKKEIAVSGEMQNTIELWQKMFQNRAPWLDENTQSLGLPTAVAGEFARLILVEMESSISGSRRGDFLQETYTTVLERLREKTEYAAATGGMVFKPYVNDGRLVVDYVPAGRFLPTAYNSRGEITGAVFVYRVQKGKAFYTRLEHHELTNSGYIITNKAFMALTEAELGRNISLTSVEEWADQQEEIVLGYQSGRALERPLFAYFRMPFANQIDDNTPLGVSVYSRGAELMEQADRQYSRILWEYEGSELAVHTSSLAVKNAKMPERRKRLFRGLDIEGANGAELYQVFNPAIRDSSLFNGLNQILRRVEFNCYLSYGTLSDPQNQAKTAEEIKMSRQRSYSAVCEVQKALEDALRHMIWILDYYTDLFDLAPIGDYEVSFTWGDGVLTDTGTEFIQRKALVDGGYLKPELLLSWYFGISEEEAARYLPAEKPNSGLTFEE